MKKLDRINRTQKKIKKRLKIVKEQWLNDMYGFIEEHPLIKEPHRMHKWNLRCGCRLCRRKIRKSFKDKKNELSTGE